MSTETLSKYEAMQSQMKGLHYLGEGFSRQAYLLNETTVRKFAFDSSSYRGANLDEIDNYEGKGSVTRVINYLGEFYRVRMAQIKQYDPEGYWLDMEYFDTLLWEAVEKKDNNFALCYSCGGVGLDAPREDGCICCILLDAADRAWNILDIGTCNVAYNHDKREFVVIDYAA